LTIDEMPDLPPPAAQRINQLHCWIATYPNGSEGIISADMPMPGYGIRHMPLMASKREVAEGLAGLARRAQRAAMHKTDRMIRIRLCSFDRLPETQAETEE
jgi:hypothetical protein